MNGTQRKLIGKSISNLLDAEGDNVYQMERNAVNNPKGDFIEYHWKKPSSTSSETSSPKTSFVRGVKEWEWMIGAGVYTDDVEKEIASIRTEMNSRIKEKMLYFALIISGIIILFLFFLDKLTGRLKNDFYQFTTFFNKATESDEPINQNLIQYNELFLMAEDANKMVADKKLIRHNLLDEKEKLSVTIRSIGDGVITTDISGNIELLNPVAEKLTGWATDDAKNKHLSEVFKIVHAKTGNVAQNPVEKVLSTGKIVGLANHTMLISKDKTEYQIADSAAPIQDGNGEITGVVLVFRDVTEEYKIQKDLKESEELFRTICENAPILIDSFDQNGHCTLWNKHCEKVFGWTIDEVNSYEDTLALFYPDQEIKAQVLKTIIAEPDEHFREWQPLTKSGKPVTTMWANFKLPNGKVVSLGHDITERKEAENALRKSEKEYRSTVDGLLVGVVVHSADGSILLSNPEASSILGLTPEQMSGKELTDPAWTFVNEDLSPVEIKDYPVSKVISTTKPFTGNILGVKRPDKENITWITVNAVPLFSGDNKLNKIIINFVDITERKKAEEKLLATSELNEKIVSESPIGISIYDDSGKCVAANESLGRIIGATKEQSLAQNYKTIKSWKSTGLFETAKKATRTGITQHQSLSLKSTFGKDLDVECFFIPLKKGSSDLMLMTNDITDRMRAEKALKESETKFRGLVESSSDCIWEMNIDGIHTYVSPQIEVILGYTPDEVIGKPLHELMPPEEAKHISGVFRDILKTGKPFVSQENTFTHKSGHQVIVETNGVPVFNESGGVIGYRGIDRDITERKKVENALVTEKIFTDTIIQSMPGLFYIFEKQSAQFKQRNNNWTIVSGYSNDELDTMTALEVVVDKDLCFSRMQEVYDQGSSSMENCLLTKTGRTDTIFLHRKTLGY